jgi:hypothetical protein
MAEIVYATVGLHKNTRIHTENTAYLRSGNQIEESALRWCSGTFKRIAGLAPALNLGALVNCLV